MLIKNRPDFNRLLFLCPKERKERVCAYWTPEDDIAAVYGPQDDVPVGIFSGELKIPMREIFEQIRQMWPEEE